MKFKKGLSWWDTITMDLKYQHQNVSYSTYVKFIFDGFKISKIIQKGSKSANDLVLLGMGYDLRI